ncbi:threonylcarbamoyl-AMP synthase [Lutibacter sp. B2]|nr:threonylcarbamoyl-AMP synthase [Lutibacter sp. B2]
MKTKIFEIDDLSTSKDKIKEAADLLIKGGTVAFPTETVYGLGANALDEEAVAKIFKAKGRPSDNPLIVHISKIEQLYELVESVPPIAEKLIERFWPGPITLIMKKSNNVPDIITAGLDTVAIRMPSHAIAKEIIDMAKLPIAAPSANLSGKPSPTKASHVIKDLNGKVDGIVSGGSSQVGLESTVLDITLEIPMILRPGGITKEDLEQVLERVEIDPGIEGVTSDDVTPRAPGMKYTHYSPQADVIIVSGKVDEIVPKIIELTKQKQKEGKKVGIMCTDETKNKYMNGIVYSMGSREKIETIATKLFDTLRQFDEEDVDLIFAEGIDRKSVGHAIMNRMIKAAGYNVIKSGR